MRRLALLVVAWLALLAAPAAAHPLGNFTVNTADRVVVDDRAVLVTHLVDLAEIPTVQLRGRWDTDGDERLSAAELSAYATSTCPEDAALLRLAVDGRDVPLRLTSSAAEARPGQGGLPTTRLTCELTADAAPRGAVVFTDDAGAGRTGWREVTATARCGSLKGADVPEESPSALLTAYPEDLLASPVDVRSAAFTAVPGPCTGGSEAARAERTAVPRGLGGLASSVTDFLGRPGLTLSFALLSALAAVAFGAVHALAPGHGKTVLAAYLVGQRGTPRQALQLGAVVTFTHTASVLLLGAVLALGTLAAPERIVPATEALSGVLLAAVGVYLLVLAVRRRRGLDHTHDDDHHHDHGGHGHDHPHPHDHPHDHDHPHPHPHDHPHDHDHRRPPAPAPRHDGPGGKEGTLVASSPAAASADPAGGLALATVPEPDAGHRHEPVPARPLPGGWHSHGGRAHSHEVPDGPLTWRSLAAMGVAGGLVPSPSALVVLLGATYLGRAWFGVVLVLLYGVGMAVTLTAAGLLLLRAQAALDRRGWALGRDGRIGRLLPLLTAGVVVVLGVVLLVRGLVAGAALG